MTAFAHHSIGSKPKGETDPESEQRLPEQFDDGAHTILVLLAIGRRGTAEFANFLEEKWHAVILFAMTLEVIIEEAEHTEPKSGEQHQEHVDVAQTPHQQAGNDGGYDDDDAAHGGDTDLFDSIRVDFTIALRFGSVLATHIADKPFAERHGDDQCQDECRDGTCRHITPHAGSRQVEGVVEISKDVV